MLGFSARQKNLRKPQIRNRHTKRKEREKNLTKPYFPASYILFMEPTKSAKSRPVERNKNLEKLSIQEAIALKQQEKNQNSGLFFHVLISRRERAKGPRGGRVKSRIKRSQRPRPYSIFYTCKIKNSEFLAETLINQVRKPKTSRACARSISKSEKSALIENA